MAVYTQAAPSVVGQAIPTDPIWRLSVAQYQQMTRQGILTDDDAVELLQGWLVTKMPKNPPHRLSTQLLREVIAQVLPAGWYVDAQEPITTADSEPEPDLTVVRGERRQYRDRHPTPADVALVIEVSDTTLQRDRTIKKRIYGRAGIVCYWIVNLVEQQIEVYTQPSGAAEEPSYHHRQDYQPDDMLTLTLDEQFVHSFSVREVLP